MDFLHGLVPLIFGRLGAQGLAAAVEDHDRAPVRHRGPRIAVIPADGSPGNDRARGAAAVSVRIRVSATDAAVSNEAEFKTHLFAKRTSLKISPKAGCSGSRGPQRGIPVAPHEGGTSSEVGAVSCGVNRRRRHVRFVCVSVCLSVCLFVINVLRPRKPKVE